MAGKEEYPYPDGSVLNESLCRKFNGVIGYLDDSYPISGIYRLPERSLPFDPRPVPEDLITLHESLTTEERQSYKQVFGRVINYLRSSAKERERIGEIIEPEEYFPSLGYCRNFTPVGLSQVYGLARIGRLFFYHSIKAAPTSGLIVQPAFQSKINKQS